ncbi:hypothetical protein MRB53_035803 [Persea americana]|uniref:Uncharacterized protein n=1 Tax=Persea americana TaxID=3435 RepID=A0ACC2K5Y3_PERAE|nr:hypothetical protein MRB53_035803 [Persea americana]
MRRRGSSKRRRPRPTSRSSSSCSTRALAKAALSSLRAAATLHLLRDFHRLRSLSISSPKPTRASCSGSRSDLLWICCLGYDQNIDVPHPGFKDLDIIRA